jgi:iron(III) transport system substrate-binding protein
MKQSDSFLAAFIVCLIIGVSFLPGCGKQDSAVTVYVSHDRNLSEPILNQFYEQTGIEVRPVYDTEANKTTGLVNRLIAERDHPQADVFWNNELGRTLQLKVRGMLAPYSSPAADRRDGIYRDSDGTWTGFGARARVLVVNENQFITANQPKGLLDFVDPLWHGKAAIANPHFGTTGTHFSALFVAWGEDKFRIWVRAMKENDVALLPGNAQVRDKVAAGEYAFGLTDTDDVNGAILDGKPVRMVIPDQGEDGLGVFVIPNTVAMIHGGPHPDVAKQLIDYLLSAEVEAQLAQGRGAQIPLQPGVPGPDLLPSLSKLHQMQVDYAEVGAAFDRMLQVFREEWQL